MELIETIVCYIFGLINIFLLLFAIIYLIQKRNFYPFSKTSPYSTTFFLSCVLLHEFFYFLLTFNLYRDNLFIQKMLKVSISINVNFFFFIPIFFRMNNLIKLIKFNYYHLTYYSQLPEFKQENCDSFFKSIIYYSNKDKESFLYSFSVFFICNLFVIFILKSSEISSCYLFIFTQYTRDVFFSATCEVYETFYVTIFLHFLRYLIYYGELIYLVHLFFELWKFPIKSDIFYVRLEITVNVVWFIFHNFFNFFFLPERENFSYFAIFIGNSLINFSFIILYLFIIQLRKRKKIKNEKKNNVLISNNKPNYINLLNNYGQFMRNFICFTYFKNFINEKPQFKYIQQFLKFFIDYYLFKLHLKNSKNLKKIDSIIHAYYIYWIYFWKENSSKNSLILDVPSEFKEKIEEASQNGFCLPRSKLNIIYDEVFQFALNKLYNIYVIILNNKNENKKLCNIFSHLEFDEVKESITANNFI